ncbi:MAG: nitrogen fixation protein NifQ, partial [Mangrovicoccus sp.]
MPQLKPDLENDLRPGLVQSDLACILAHALAEHLAGLGEFHELLGLTPEELTRLGQRWFPGLDLPISEATGEPVPDDQNAVALLLLWRGGSASEEARWLAKILARRSLCGGHLWEDLGLPNRKSLSALMARHFPRIFAANSANMRWKKFFYRQICSDQDFALCLSPTC